MKKATGFTLIELLITIAVGGILLSIAIPSYGNFVKNNCLTTTTNDLVTSFQVARSESIKRRVPIIISTTGGWGTDWTVWDDANSDDTLDAGEEIRVESVTCGGGNVTITEGGSDTSFFYSSSGFIDAAGTFSICDDRTGERGQQISISSTGRVNTTSLTCT